eukprot:TRINITY_DN60886_c0_g1_i1.p1 TRINITY_DN60886_c0_g1~~TRINITY_DN60886_c0_g1_i1.p1  ORF type:complete len:380 (+),score=100.52 TRINITY_DN60886_c0_g1_i1:86-1225(+)
MGQGHTVAGRELPSLPLRCGSVSGRYCCPDTEGCGCAAACAELTADREVLWAFIGNLVRELRGAGLEGETRAAAQRAFLTVAKGDPQDTPVSLPRASAGRCAPKHEGEVRPRCGRARSLMRLLPALQALSTPPAERPPRRPPAPRPAEREHPPLTPPEPPHLDGVLHSGTFSSARSLSSVDSRCSIENRVARRRRDAAARPPALVRSSSARLAPSAAAEPPPLGSPVSAPLRTQSGRGTATPDGMRLRRSAASAGHPAPARSAAHGELPAQRGGPRKHAASPAAEQHHDGGPLSPDALLRRCSTTQLRRDPTEGTASGSSESTDKGGNTALLSAAADALRHTQQAREILSARSGAHSARSQGSGSAPATPQQCSAAPLG